MQRKRYNHAPQFSADAYTVSGWGAGIAWYVLGWETIPDHDTEWTDHDTDWTGYRVQTGKLVMVMVGDDKHFSIDPDDVTPLERGEYCGECGQVGCGHGALVG